MKAIMKTSQVLLISLISSVVLASTALAQTSAPTCNAVAQERKIFGAAKTSFLKKCEREATEKCEAAATERKLAGAAKNSNVKKCVKDAVGE
jgi:hypothetical protein